MPTLRKVARKALPILLLASGLFLTAPLPASAATQNAYRWRNDNGSEAAASFLAAENTAGTLAKDAAKRLRFGLHNNGTETEFLKKTVLTFLASERDFETILVDPAAGFMYVAPNISPGRVIKVNLSTHAKVATLDFPSGEDGINSGVIDTAGGFAYFATANSPAKIVKVNLTTFTRVGSITLASGEDSIQSAAIDTAAGFAYFGAYKSPGKVIKVNLSTFAKDSTLTFATGENLIKTSTVDAAGGFAYFGLETSPGKVVKVSLSSFTASATLDFASGENFASTSVIDTVDGFIYFGLNTNPGKIVKVSLSSFTASATLTATDPQFIRSAVIDMTSTPHFAYFTSANSPAKINKINLSTFTVTGTLSIGSGNIAARGGVIDTAGGFAYFGTASPGRTVKVKLSDFTLNSTLTYEQGENGINTTLIDEAAGFAYLGSGGSVSGRVIKIRLSDFTQVATLDLATDETGLSSGFIDTAGGYAYFGTFQGTCCAGKIIKIRLSDFTKTGTLTLQSDEPNLSSVVFDSVAGFSYWGTNASTSKIVKVNMSTFTRTGAISLPVGEDSPQAGALDSAAGFAYFGTGNNPAKVIKIQLSDFTRVGSITMATGESNIGGAAFDSAAGIIYFGTRQNPAKIIKVQVSDFTATATLTLNSGDDSIYAVLLDKPSGYLYVPSNQGGPGTGVVRVKLSDFTRVDKVFFSFPSEINVGNGIIDLTRGYAYFGTGTAPGKFIKVSIAPHVSPRLEFGVKTTTCAAIGTWTQVPAASGAHWQMVDSTNLTNEAVTTNVAAGLTDGNTAFKSGVTMDLSSQASEISLGTSNFTEVEYSLKPTMDATNNGTYCFRLTNAGVTTGLTFSQYAEATVVNSLSTGPSCSPPDVFLAFPKGGENVAAGSLTRIFWSSEGCGITGMRLTLSTDGGETYHVVIIDNIGNFSKGFHDWTVPSELRASKAKIRIEALGQGGAALISDASDVNFTVSGPSEEMPPEEPTVPSPFVPEEESEAAKDIDTVLGLTPIDGPTSCDAGTALKGSTDTIYYCGSDGKKHVFPNEKTFKTWFSDFSQVMTLSDLVIASIPEGDPVRYKPGVRMIKIQSDAKTYAVSAGGVLRWVETEAKAAELYGTDWNTKIDDMEEILFATYEIGDPI